MNIRYERLNVKQFHERWQQARNEGSDVVIVDVRSADEFAGGHVPGAKLMPLEKIHGMTGNLSRHEPVYLICHSGMRSQMAAKILAGQGFEHLVNIDGGTMAWRQSGYPVDAG